MKEEFTEIQCEYGQADIYIAGNSDLAKHYCSEYCLSGLCVSVFDCEYVYTGGQEKGVKVTMINYARFPTDQEDITEKAKDLGEFLCRKLHQSSFSVMSPCGSFFLSRRDD